MIHSRIRLLPIISVVLISLVLSLILYFPIGIDHAVYTRGGQATLDGTKLYKDFIDTKPPIIYYIFALKIILFGDSEISLRIFDLFWQIITIALLVTTVFKRTGNQLSAWSAGIIYSLLYTTLGFAQTMECETLPGWAFIGILYIYSGDDRNLLQSILTGICIGWAMAFKYTFGILLPVLFLYDILNGRPFKKLFQDYFWITTTSFITLAFTFLALIDNDVRHGYALLLKYQAIYAGFPAFDLNLVRYVLKATTAFYSDRYSIAFVIFTIISCASVFKNSRKDLKISSARLLILSCFIGAGLILSAFIERKVNPYHFSRTYIPLSVLAGIGAAIFMHGIQNYYLMLLKENSVRAAHYICGIAGCLILILFSPIPRWINLAKLPFLYYTNTAEYDKLFDNPNDNAVARTQHKAVAQYIIKRKTLPGEKTFIMSVASGTIDYFMKNRPGLRFASTLQLHFNYWGIDDLHRQARKDLETTTWLVVQNNDRQPFFNGHDKSNWESLRQDSLLYPYVRDSFKSVDTIGNFYIFKRKF